MKLINIKYLESLNDVITIKQSEQSESVLLLSKKNDTIPEDNITDEEQYNYMESNKNNDLIKL